MAFFLSKKDVVSEIEKGKYGGDGVQSSRDLLRRDEDQNPFGYRWKKRSFLYLGIKVFISFIAVLLCTAALTWLFPDGRGAGSRYFREVSDRLKSENQALPKWVAQPGGQAVIKLEEVAALVPFTLKFPTYLPDQAELVEVVLYDSGEVYYYFNSGSGFFLISQRDANNSAISLELSKEEIQAKEIDTTIFHGVFSFNKEDTNLLSFIVEQSIHVMLYGQIDETELVKVLDSLIDIF